MTSARSIIQRATCGFLLSAGAGAQERHLPDLPRPVPSELAAKLPRDCSAQIRGKSYFVGDVHCLKLFPVKRLRGFWLTNLETSVFFPDPKHPPASDGWSPRDVPWLETAGISDSRVRAALKDSGFGVYAVDMLAHAPPLEGAYGDRGMYLRGLLLERLISLKLVRSGALPPLAAASRHRPKTVPGR